MNGPVPARVAFGRSCKRLREERGLTRQQLADMAKVSDTTIGKLEVGMASCYIETADLIAAALGSDITSMIREGR